MIRQCLICDSKAVLTLEAARGIALMFGLTDGAVRGAQNTQESPQGRPGYGSLMNGLAAIVPAYPSALRIADDVGKYQFSGFDCLCLRCGALFDEEAAEPVPPVP
ncbi:UNVERIFIED_ORG: hypothetical protein EDF86_4616 [Pseudomonas psychrophila]